MTYPDSLTVGDIGSKMSNGQELSAKLSFRDLLAHVIPGLVALIGLALMFCGLNDVPIAAVIPNAIQHQVWVAALVIAMAYVLGMISSIPGRNIERWHVKATLGNQPLKGLLKIFEPQFRVAFDTFWRAHFKQSSAAGEPPIPFEKYVLTAEDLYPLYYFCRAAIRDRFPAARVKIDRAGSHRQGFRNLLLPTFVLCLGALVWVASQRYTWREYVIDVTAIVTLGVLVEYSLIKGMGRCRRREMYESMFTFLVARTTGWSVNYENDTEE